MVQAEQIEAGQKPIINKHLVGFCLMLFSNRRNRFEEGAKIVRRVYFVGAHSTGKTTLSSFIADKLDWHYIEEQATAILRDKAAPSGGQTQSVLAAIRKDLYKAGDFQLEIWKRQRQAEEEAESDFISDRSFDSVAYAAATSLVAKELRDSVEFQEYLGDLRAHGSITFFVRPQLRFVHEDESWSEICRIDGMIEYILETEGIPYIPLESPSMRSRVRTVEGVLHAAGVPYDG